MRIAHVVTRMQRSGSERNIAHFVRWQLDHGHDVVVVAGPDPDWSLLPPDARVAVIPDLVRDLSPRRDRRALRQLSELLGSERFDVVHTHQSKAGVLGRLLRHADDRVVVHTVHMPSFGPSYGYRSAALAAVERRCARSTDLFITVGEELREVYLAAGIGTPDQYRVVRSPIDLDAFTPVRDARPDQRRQARQHLGLDPSLPTLATIGALEPRKRHDLAITAALPELANGQAQLLIAGDGPERHRLEEHARRLGVDGAVHLVGHLDDVTRAFSAADVMLHTSTAEGVPQVVIQSLAAGVPVVVASVTGVEEIATPAVVIAEAESRELTEQVRATLRRPPSPCPHDVLAAWHPVVVERDIARLHDDVDLLLSMRRSSHSIVTGHEPTPWHGQVAASPSASSEQPGGV